MINPVILPESSLLKRYLRTTDVQRGDLKFDKTDLDQYDFKTVFYDVFLNQANNRIYLVGPPLLNLAREITPIRARINGTDVPLKWKEYLGKRLSIAQADLTGVNITEINEVKLDLSGVLLWKQKIQANTHPAGKRILTAIQKNNRSRWILDWCKYYRQHFDIDQVILYDNNSANRDELISDLAELDYVKIIPWDFPYGIYRSHGNKFCQTGALNHCRLKFGKDAVLFNFDIDELLVYPSEKLYSFLEKGKIVKFGGISVPVVGELPEDYSYDYFTQRKKLGQMGLQKYVCRSNAIIVNHVHKARHKRGNLTTNLDRAKFSLHKFLKKLTGKSDLPANLAYREIDLEDGYYLHYQGINTGWKKGERTLNIQEDLELQKIT